jgi:hypothetical protein
MRMRPEAVDSPWLPDISPLIHNHVFAEPGAPGKRTTADIEGEL